MRPLNLVVEAIRNVARTKEFEGKSEFLVALRMMEGKCSVENIEANNHLWAELSGILEKHLGSQSEPWKEKIADLYQGREDYTKYL